MTWKFHGTRGAAEAGVGPYLPAMTRRAVLASALATLAGACSPLAALNALDPPFVDVSARPPAAPLVWSQARNVRPASSFDSTERKNGAEA